MPHIVVDEQQARLIAEVTEGVELRDNRGRHLGYVVRGFPDAALTIAPQRPESDRSRDVNRQVADQLRVPEDQGTPR